MAFAELAITSNFTFLTGASHAEEYALRGALFGLPAIAIADRNSVSGIVRAHVKLRDIAKAIKAREEGDADTLSTLGLDLPEGTEAPRPLPGARICLASGTEVTCLPRDRAAWGRLCQLLTAGRLRAEKGACTLHLADLLEYGQGQELLIHPPQALPSTPAAGAWLPEARQLSRRYENQCTLLARPYYDGQDAQRIADTHALAEQLGIPLALTAAPLMHHGTRRRLADVLTCIREGITVDRLGRRAQANAERRLRSEAEMLRLFPDHQEAIAETGRIAARCTFSLEELRYEYPSEIMEGEAPQARLERLTAEGLRWRYPEGTPEKVEKQARHELALIGRLAYAPYFLTVEDAVRFARSRDILCQGRGSAANSVVCFALGITSVSPEIGTMVFERFVSEARDEPPDIDVDFEHERREEVIQYIYQRYGRHRAGLCATVIHYRGKRAIREVGKAMGLSDDTISAMSSQLWGWGSAGVSEENLREIGLDPADRRLQQTLDLVEQIRGFPRHLSQHVGGFIMTEGRLDALVPIENAAMEDRTVICWDKDDIDALGILKVDVLSLGMLTCIRKAFELMRAHHGLDYDLATLPPEDAEVYDMLCNADSIGVFQVESRAQMNFL
ncbi:MAG: error-prone DNA polymerase, partial [Pseudomonadota bacterium]